MPNEAIRVFKEIKVPDEVNLILLLNACAQLGTAKALSVVNAISSNIPKSFFSNPRINASLLDAFIKCGDLVSAEKLFNSIGRSTIGYGNLMSGYNRFNRSTKTIELFRQMEKESVVPDRVTFLPIITALSRLRSSPLARSIIDRIPKSILALQDIQNALIDMWASALLFHVFTPLFYFLQQGRSGHINEAQSIFDNMPQPDRVAYNAMSMFSFPFLLTTVHCWSLVNAYGLNGKGAQALELFHRMPSDLVDQVTHVCVLNACSHSRRVDQARAIFRGIDNASELTYCAMVSRVS